MVNIENLHFGYKRRKDLFEDLSLKIANEKIVGLLGKNGSGKSTLLRLVNGILAPGSGVCEVFGYNAHRANPEMLSEIFLMPEEFYVPPVTIRKYANVYKPFYKKFSGEQFNSYLKEFALSDDIKLSELSFGQKKKFYLAFGLACNTRLCILDEPTNGLDIPSKSQFRKIVASSLTEDKTIIVSTHQVKDVENLIDNIIVLDDGKIIFNKAIDAINNHLLFYHDSDARNKENIIYSEGFMANKSFIEKNEKSTDSKIDLELLFNAIINETDKINQVFNN